MNLLCFITNRKAIRDRWSVISFALIAAFVFLFTASISAQKIAVVSPENTSISNEFSLKLSEKLNSLDADLVANAFRSASYENIFNLTTSEAKSIGEAIGCEYFVVVKSDNFKRSSFAKGDYYESFAAIYLVSSRTGHLVFWKLYSFEDKRSEIANEKLFAAVNTVVTNIKDNSKSERFEKPNVLELPEEDKSYRSPLPFKRVKPVYTDLAALFLISATVDIEVDLDEKGEITRTEIVRWAGFGLDESVTDTVRKMNWRPALRNGKALPIRVLLRYNFKKLEKVE